MIPRALERRGARSSAGASGSVAERWDGSGYPNGLRADDCPREARIVAVVDVYDALGQVRCYKKAWSEEQIVTYFREKSGLLFEAPIVDALFESIPRLEEIAATLPEPAGF